VLVIDGDDWIAMLLSDGLCEHGFAVKTCMSGADALTVAATFAADCVISEMMLPELDGPSLVRAIRSGQPQLRSVPILILTNSDTLSSRSAAFRAGADVFMTKPFRLDEVALQVQALLSMCDRLAGFGRAPISSTGARFEVACGSDDSSHNAFEGNIAQMSIATVLTLLEMERRSGVLTVSHRDSRCALELVAGFAVGGKVGSMKVSPLAVLREILHWKEGRFLFCPGSDGAVPANRWSIGALLIETVRLDDELARDNSMEDSILSRPSWPVPPLEARRQSLPPRSRPPRPPSSVRGSRTPPSTSPKKSAPRPASRPSSPRLPVSAPPPLPPLPPLPPPPMAPPLPSTQPAKPTSSTPPLDSPRPRPSPPPLPPSANKKR